MVKIAITGLPGSGKDTHADKASARYDIPAFSAGGVLRENARYLVHSSDEQQERDLAFDFQGAPIASHTYANKMGYRWHALERIDDVLHGRGEGPSDETTRYFLEPRLQEQDEWILNGYPRTGGQAQHLQEMADIDVLVVTSANKHELRERLNDRGREDDTPEKIENRLAWQSEGLAEVFGVLEYGHSDIPIKIIDTQQPIEDASQDLYDLMEEYGANEVNDR